MRITVRMQAFWTEPDARHYEEPRRYRPLNKDPNNPRKILRVISRPAVRATLFAMVSKTLWRDDVLARAGAFRLLVGALYIRLSSSAACSASLAACSARSFSFS
jgi:hypothetical protein